MSKTVDLDIPHSAEERARRKRNFLVGNEEQLRAALKLAAIIIEMHAPTTIDGVLANPWDDLLEHINATLDGRPTKTNLQALRAILVNG